jgi:hypothetical protein
MWASASPALEMETGDSDFAELSAGSLVRAMTLTQYTMPFCGGTHFVSRAAIGSVLRIWVLSSSAMSGVYLFTAGEVY